MISVAGAGCVFHECAGIETFAAHLRGGVAAAGPLARRPNETGEAALLRAGREVCREALVDAKLQSGARVAVIVVAQGEGVLSPNAEALADAVRGDAGALTPNLVRAVVFSSVYDAIAEAREVIGTDDADAALVVGLHVAENGAIEKQSEAFSVAFEAANATPPPAEGAAAIAFVRRPEGETGRPRLASLSSGSAGGARGLQAALDSVFADVHWRASEIGLLALTGRRRATIAESTAYSKTFASGPRETALFSVCAVVGDAGPAADVASVISATLALESAMIPPVPNWGSAGPTSLRAAEGLYVSSAERVWLTRESAPLRRALVNLETGDGASGVLAFEAAPSYASIAPVATTATAPGRPLLYTLTGGSRADLESRLDELGEALNQGRSLVDLARSSLASAQASAKSPEKLAIVAANRKELEREITFMKRALEKAASTGKAVRTPNGSVYTPAPVVAGGGKVAFVCPGIGSGYVGLGREVLVSFARRVTATEPVLNRRLPTLLRTDLTYPKGMAAFSESDEKAFTDELNSDAASLLLVGIAFGVVHSELLRGVLRLEPDIAFGYSIGELGIRIALGQLSDWRTLDKQLSHPALQSGLTGEMNAVQAYWRQTGRTAPATPASGNPHWASYVVKGKPEDLQEALKAYPHVFIASINGPEEVVIGGAPEACAALMARTGTLGMQLEFSFAVHAPPAATIVDDLYKFCDNPIRPLPHIDFYSAHTQAPVMQTRVAIAETLSQMLAQPFDFRQLVETVYDAGARVFIETGVRNNCTNWIGATLGDRPHLAVAMDIKGLPSDVAWMRAVAQLYANHVAIDLTELFDTDHHLGDDEIQRLLETA